MFRIKYFRQIVAPVTWLLALFVMLLVFAVIFQSSAKELAILFAIDAIVLNPTLYLFERRLFYRLFPDAKPYFMGLDHDKIARYSLAEKRAMLTSLMHLPRRRALYGLVVSSLYKIPPAIFIIAFVWEYQLPVATQVARTIVSFLLFYSYFAALTYAENHELVSSTIAEIHARHDWSDVFQTYQLPISKRSFELMEGLALGVVWILMLGLQAIVVVTHEPTSTVPLWQQNAIVAFTGLLFLTRMWWVSRRFFYEGLQYILQTFEGIDFSKPTRTVGLHSSPILARFEQTFNTLTSRLLGAEREVSLVITREADRYRFQSLGEISAMISHDLANPLGVILFCAERGRENPEVLMQPRYVDMLHQHARHALDLVESLRAYLRNPSGVPTRVSYRDAHEHVVRLLSFQHPHEVTQAMVLDEPEAVAGRRLAIARSDLIQILFNLYSNALTNFVVTGTAAPRLNVSLRAEGDVLRVAIEDNGSGLSSVAFEDMTAYSLLSTAAEARRGLGLRLTRRMTERYGGSLEVEERATEVGGTTFVLRLKLEPAEHPG